MSSNYKNIISISTSPLFILFLVFLVLKLTETIDWSWWWITAPLWMPAIMIIGIITMLGIIGLTILLIAGILELLP